MKYSKLKKKGEIVMDEEKLKKIQLDTNIGAAVFTVASSVIGLILAIKAKH